MGQFSLLTSAETRGEFISSSGENFLVSKEMKLLLLMLCSDTRIYK